MSVLLEARGVTKVFGSGLFDQKRVVALEDFSMSISKDDPSIVAVVGESGSGKTTLARILLGLETPTAGDILYEGVNLQTLSRIERHEFRRNVQVVFQDPFEVYNPFYRVDHVLNTPIVKFGLAKSPTERKTQIEGVLEAVGLRPDEILGRHPHQLSGGQRQRIMVARALLLKPKVIIADEPVSMIDASLRATVLANLQQLKEDFGISVIYITHDLATAFQISQNIVVMYSGSVTEVGDVNRVVTDPKHPYTQLLIGSVPRADPNLQWSVDNLEVSHDIGIKGENYCKFADRCPHVLSQCVEKAPSLYQIDSQRGAACYLYEDSPVVERDAMNSLFVNQQ